jgi:hypothetical protein
MAFSWVGHPLHGTFRPVRGFAAAGAGENSPTPADRFVVQDAVYARMMVCSIALPALPVAETRSDTA